MRVAGEASRSNRLAIFWASDNRNKAFLDLEGYLWKLALHVTRYLAFLWEYYGIQLLNASTVPKLSQERAYPSERDYQCGKIFWHINQIKKDGNIFMYVCMEHILK
jgi:hypothetical protein